MESLGVQTFKIFDRIEKYWILAFILVAMN